MAGLDISNLRQLADIITKNIDVIEGLAKAEGITHPTLDSIYDPESPAEKFTVKPDVLNAALLATSAATQLAATLRLPGLILLDRANAFHISSAIRVASEACVVELLRDAGPKGLDVKVIAEKTNTNATIMGRVLRLLATHYIFKEVEPNVFANNRLSSMIDTGKPSDVVLALAKKKRENPIKNGHGISNVQGEKYTDTNGIAALMEQCTDEVFKGTSFFAENVLSNDYTRSSFQKALQLDASLWEFFEQYPGYTQRIQMALVAWTKIQPQQQNFKGFDWTSLPKDALVIDVGGGNGSEGFEIAKKAPHVKVIVQDRAQTIQEVTKPTWEGDAEKQKMLSSGQVSLEAQDFFEPQPSHVVGKASVFYLRFITHDWQTKESVSFLKQLAAAASPQSKLILTDQLVPYACPTPPSFSHIEGSLPAPPSPLLSNLGEANCDVYTTDFSMAVLVNAQERTLGEFKEMTEQAGWKIEKVYQTVGSSLSQIVCVKV